MCTTIRILGLLVWCVLNVSAVPLSRVITRAEGNNTNSTSNGVVANSTVDDAVTELANVLAAAQAASSQAKLDYAYGSKMYVLQPKDNSLSSDTSGSEGGNSNSGNSMMQNLGMSESNMGGSMGGSMGANAGNMGGSMGGNMGGSNMVGSNMVGSSMGDSSMGGNNGFVLIPGKNGESGSNGGSGNNWGNGVNTNGGNGGNGGSGSVQGVGIMTTNVANAGTAAKIMVNRINGIADNNGNSDNNNNDNSNISNSLKEILALLKEKKDNKEEQQEQQQQQQEIPAPPCPSPCQASPCSCGGPYINNMFGHIGDQLWYDPFAGYSAAEGGAWTGNSATNPLLNDGGDRGNGGNGANGGSYMNGQPVNFDSQKLSGHIHGKHKMFYGCSCTNGAVKRCSTCTYRDRQCGCGAGYDVQCTSCFRHSPGCQCGPSSRFKCSYCRW